MGILLTFFATLAQEKDGIFIVQKEYFYSWIVPHAVENVPSIDGLDFPGADFLRGFLRLPLPGGNIIALLLFLNLIAAHALRFKLTWKKSGILLTHLGVMILLVGQFFTGIVQQESNVMLREGERKNYSELARDFEFVISDVTDPDNPKLVSIPDKILAKKGDIPDKEGAMPFPVKVLEFFYNSDQPKGDPKGLFENADQGFAAGSMFLDKPRTRSDKERDFPVAVVEFGDSGPPGRWVFTILYGMPEVIEVSGKKYEIELRNRRVYLRKDKDDATFALHLVRFRHDVYPGTNKPKDFRSTVELFDAGTDPDDPKPPKPAIYMNNPLRHQGFTFYQANFGEMGARPFTVLLTVENPLAWVPYIGTIIVAAGLLIQFTMSLVLHLNRKAKAAAKKS